MGHEGVPRGWRARQLRLDGPRLEGPPPIGAPGGSGSNVCMAGLSPAGLGGPACPTTAN